MTETLGRVLEQAAFVSVVTGLGLMVCSFLVPEARFLTLPALVLALPGLIYGLR